LFDLFIFVLRHLFLILLYLFLFYVFQQMFRLLKNQKTAQLNNEGSTSLTGSQICGPSTIPEARLVAIGQYGFQAPKIYPVLDCLNMGRAVDNQVVVADSKVSRYHARIYNRDGQYWVEDLNSKNGVFLNDIRLREPVVLADGDKLRIGNATFVFVRWGHEVEQNDTRWEGAQCK